jgi:hypothetical protein
MQCILPLRHRREAGISTNYEIDVPVQFIMRFIAITPGSIDRISSKIGHGPGEG